MKKLLTLKHWQLFGLLFFPILILQIVLIASIQSNTISLKAISVFPLVMIFIISIFFGWLYALATNLYLKLPDTVSMNLSKFKIFFFIPVLYMLFIAIGILVMFNSVSSESQLEPRIFLLIIPIHLFSMFCIFYCLYFIAKALKSVELQKQVTFSDFSAEFILLWFSFIGIWIIQPRINKLFESNNENYNTQYFK